MENPSPKADANMVNYILLDVSQPLGFRLTFDTGHSSDKNKTDDDKEKSDDDHVYSSVSAKIIEIQNRKIGLHPFSYSNKSPHQHKPTRYKSGIPRRVKNENLMSKKIGLRIRKVRMRGQAYKQGMRENDFIVKISGYDGPLAYENVMTYLRTKGSGVLTLVIKRGPDNEPPYPTFSCIEDYPSSGNPNPFGSPITSTTNVCCVHGVQTRPAFIPSQEAITSKNEPEKYGQWLPPLKNFNEWFHFMNWGEKQKSLFASRATDSFNPTCFGPGNFAYKSESRKEQNQGAAQSWISKALRRYANFANMSKIPSFLIKSRPPPDSDPPRISHRPRKILKVSSTSSTPMPLRFEQCPDANITQNPTTDTLSRVPPPIFSTTEQPQFSDSSQFNFFDPTSSAIRPFSYQSPESNQNFETNDGAMQNGNSGTPSTGGQSNVSPVSEQIHVPDEEEESEENSGKSKTPTIISAPSVVQHHGATTVHVHVKRHNKTVVQSEPSKVEEDQCKLLKDSLPIIVIDKAESPEITQETETTYDQREESMDQLSPSSKIIPTTTKGHDKKEEQKDASEESKEEETPEMELVARETPSIVDEIRPIFFAYQQSIAEMITQSALDEAQIVPIPSEEILTPELYSAEVEDKNVLPLIATDMKSADETERKVTEPIYTTFEFPSTTGLDEERKLTVGDISRQWPPPSNATGVEIVKDILERSEGDGEEQTPAKNEAKLMDKLTRHSHDENIAEKVRACQNIVHELKAADENAQSRAQKMFEKGKQRSAKFVVSSPGPETRKLQADDDKDTIRKIRNLQGVHDFNQMKREYGEIMTNLANAEKCQVISQALKSQGTLGKGAEMFIRKREEAKDWIIHDHPPATVQNLNAATNSYPMLSPSNKHLETQQRSPQSTLPPQPALLDSPRTSRRELEHITTPKPIAEWLTHDRHERLFSPVPFSARTRVPSLERINFTPARPFSTTFDQNVQAPLAYHSTLAINSYESKAADKPNEGISVPPQFSNASNCGPEKIRYHLPPRRIQSFNTLPRGWKSSLEGIGQRN